MKNILLGSLTSVLFSFNGNAQDNFKSVNREKTEFAYISIKYDNETTKYEFTTFEDLIDGSDNIFADIQTKNEDNNKRDCVVIVEISVTFSQGIENNTVTVITKSFCKTIVDAAKKMILRLNELNI
jgi:hypothetical protein